MRNPWSRGLPLKILLPILAAGAGGIYWWQQHRLGDVPFAGTRPLDMTAYTEQPAALRGHAFTVRGTVDQTLANAADSADRMIVVMTSTKRDPGTSAEPLPLKVPASLAGRMQTGREFVFKVTVGEAGVLIVQDIAEI